ncbi:GspJ family type II secretion system protein [Pseudoruegeria sp. SHC-113]|uniref:GspJ family type II secretion system protein n=1 Tax=Pseudoruegeria sp. SHC-113 TaxID=2855439 RepID=UPI0021BAF4EF|nr:GspJ family type II secretion system protein [Pseudoruegeria sp. SHC-113]MCT8161672.1 GspJ family type II secretion system protein [Pseudoruegeria sp. SHC-113]
MTPPPRQKNDGTDRGLTLIELVVAMAVFALVATMSLQAITGSLRQRDGLSEVALAASDLAVAATLIRSDLAHMGPALFHDPDQNDGPRSAFVAPAGAETLGLSTLRTRLPEAAPAGQPMRVDWRRESKTGQLQRRVWPSTQPGTSEAAGPWVTLLQGVQAFEISVLDAGGQWQSGDGQPPGATGFTDALPRAVQASVTLEATGRVDILVVRP